MKLVEEADNCQLAQRHKDEGNADEEPEVDRLKVSEFSRETLP